jgi:hypothetical protein
MDARLPRYINPYTDFGFKKLFGEEGKLFDTSQMTMAQRDAYEQSVMDYIGVREVAVTAKEDRDEEHILRMDMKGKSVQEISDLLDIPENKVLEILQKKRGN